MFVQENDGNRGKEFKKSRLVKSSRGAAAVLRTCSCFWMWAVLKAFSLFGADGSVVVKPLKPSESSAAFCVFSNDSVPSIKPPAASTCK